MQGTRLPDHEVVLLGIGHTNAYVLRMWRMKRPPRSRLTCISDFPIVTYSGMLPGVLAGQYKPEQFEIDLVRLCAANGARLILGSVIGLDQETQTLQFDDRPPLPFDVLSIGVGSTVHPVDADASPVECDPRRIPIKPMQTFLFRFQEHLDQLPVEREATRRLAVVGLGAGGIEIALCIGQLLRSVRSEERWQVVLVGSSPTLLPEFQPSTQKRIRRELELAHVEVRTECRVRSTSDAGLLLEDGQTLNIDLAVWASGATAPGILNTLGLPIDDRGFLLVDENLQSTGGMPVFAVGDAAALPFEHVTKAGVYAVREGPILWENLQKILRKERLVPYKPQRDFLRLLNTGNGSAVGQYGRLSFAGRWVWKLKDRIDVRFMEKYQNYEPMEMQPEAVDADEAMRCLGCGGKVGGSVLQRVLQRIEPFEREETIVGIRGGGDDAALLAPVAGHQLAATTDFFVAPWDDPYHVGRIAALHAASDCFAMGSEPFAALANVTLQLGKPGRQEESLFQLLTGANDAFKEMRTSLVGGHTIEGTQLAVGFAILSQHDKSALLKSQMREGDALVITKPIGIGVLLAAQMQARCKGPWWSPCLASMLASNGPAAMIARQIGVHGMTDVTGFGVAGHLGEMLKGSGLSAEIEVAALPLLPGAVELTREGLESTLAPANRDWEEIIRVNEKLRLTPEYALLFDPQTSGGLMIAVADAECDRLLDRLAATDTPGHRIGNVMSARDGYIELVCR
jgi:selenide,water dikinase